MTRDDIEHIAQCLTALKAQIGKVYARDEHARMIDRFLWAIHASHDNPKFDEGNFRDRAFGEVADIFPQVWQEESDN